MFAKLDEVERKYLSLTGRLGDGSLAQNAQEFQTVAREEANLRPIIEAYRLYRHKKKELEDNREIFLSEKDEALRQMIKEETALLEKDLESLTAQLKIALIPKDPNDDKNIFLEIRAGTGGDEAALFAADLFRMYSRFAEVRGWKVEIASSSPTGIGGFKEIIALISGERVYSLLKYESGVHRVQRVPKTEAQGRVHTSAVTVAVIPEADELEVKIEDKDLRIDVFRSGGHGGQSVNTTDSAVRITHIPSGTVVICQDEKSQHKNKAKAMKVLRSRIYDFELQQRQDAEAKDRKEQVKSGDRSEKIRTYNFPQNRLTDHRIGLTVYQLDSVMEGKVEMVLEPVQAYYQSEALKKSND